MTKLIVFLGQLHSVSLQVGNVQSHKLRIDAARFIGDSALFKLPRSAVRHGEDLAVLYGSVNGFKVLVKQVAKVGDKLHVLATDRKRETVHRSVTKCGKSRFVKEAYASRQIVKGLLDGSIVDGFSILGFTQDRPHGKCEGYDRCGKCQDVRQVQDMFCAGDTAVHLHQHVEGGIQ